ncbi:hypothetical protein [Endozoicomonas sp. ISHI1]|uniref:hypothetical protein n=2 Tax=Endozoicomonas TaxID=305899 RepID=UPI0021492B41|nr:hypothetical protein [Endozoicomonas sp. ISHI1]
MKPTLRTELLAMPPEVPDNTSNKLNTIAAAGGDDGDKPTDRNNWNPDPESRTDLDLNLVSDPIQKCLQQKKQLLQMLRIKRLWAITTGQTTLARILSNRIMVIEADLLDLERSNTANMHPVLVQTRLAENGRELSVYLEVTSDKYSGRQAANREKSQSSQTTKASTTETKSQTRKSHQVSQAAAHRKVIGSTVGNGRGGDDPMEPSAAQDTASSVVTCTKCGKALNLQELRRVAHEAAVSALLCKSCLSGTRGKKRARPPRQETEPDSSEPVQKKKKGPGRKRKNSKATNAPPAKKKKPTGTQTTDGPLEKVKAHIKYELSQEELEKAQTLMEVFKKKNITVKPTFYKLLGFVERKSFDGFFVNATTFFEHLSENFKNTGMLTSMLNNNKKHIRSFAERSQSELQYLASLKVLTSFSSMNKRKGVPGHKEVKAILGWHEWKGKDGEFNSELFRSFSSMNHGRGILKHGEVREVLGWPEWKDKDGELSIELFRAFSSMNSSKGMLKHEEVKEVLGWPEWKDSDGKFSVELFRTFSSLNSGRGMLEHKEVKEVLGWPEWKGKDGEFSMELLRAFSSMNHNRGMLKHEEVKELLGWPEWKDKDGEFSIKLFRSFSSMNSSKGMPKYKQVKEVLGWPEWKDRDGEFSTELFRAFSSMNTSKGMLKHKDVKEVLSWPEWKHKDGEFSIELFRAFASMNSSKGMLNHEEVKDVLDWPEWKDKHGEFCMELFRSVSSMYAKRSLPEHMEIKEMLGWPEWKDKDGEFFMELFRAFSSMNSSKGMLKHEEVKEVLGWPEWKDRDGEFSMELFRAFSSMNRSQGKLKHEKVKEVLGWSEWKDKDNEFNIQLFRAFTSLNHGQGILKHEQVKEVLNWPEWKHKDDDFDIELFRAFSSMNHSKGVLKHEKVKEILNWPEWKHKDGKFNMKLFRTFSSMNCDQGLPKHKPVKKVLGWIGDYGPPNHWLLQVMTRLWKSAGLPAVEVLQHQERQLKESLFTEFTGEHCNPNNEADDGYNGDSEGEEDKCNRQIKTVALYLSTLKPDWSLTWTVLKQFCQLHEKTKTVLMLESLIGLLSSSGGKSVSRYLQANQQDRLFLWRHSMKAVPLHVLNKAMLLSVSDEDRERFVYFAKRLKSLPNQRLWEQYSVRLQPLSGLLKFDYMQRLYLKILQPLTKDDQLRFLNASHARAVFELFPSLSALQKLSEGHSSQYLKQLLEACLQLKTHDVTKEGIQIVFEALLETHSLLPWNQDIPDNFLSGMRKTDNNHVEIPVSGLIPSGEQLALSYIAVLMQNLNEMSFTVKGHWLEVEVMDDGVEIYRYPMPQLKIQDEKMAISNWSEEQFRFFLKITGVSEQYYLTADQWQKRLNPDDPVCIQRHEARLAANKALNAKGAIETAAFSPLPVHVLATLIKRGMAIKPIVWKSLDHHKEKLPESLLGKLKERIEVSGTECPDEVKESLSQYLDSVQSGAAEACEPISEPEPQSVNPTDEKSEKQAFGSLWLKLNQTEVFGTEILTLLDEYKDEMELIHIVTVLKKAKINISDHILEGWIQRAFSEIKRLKMLDPLLSEVDPDVYESCQELDLLDGSGSTL